MAHSGKAQMKNLTPKKSEGGGGGGGGGGKKKHKQKKPSSDQTGDGSPSSTSVAPSKTPEIHTPVIQNDAAKVESGKKKTEGAHSNENVKKDKSKQQSVNEVEQLSDKLKKTGLTDSEGTKSSAIVTPAKEVKSQEELKEKTLEAAGSVTKSQEVENKGNENESAETVGKKKENKKKELGSSENKKKEVGSNQAEPGEQKSKSQLRAERRAIQEAQRAAKENKKATGAPASSVSSTTTAIKTAAVVEKAKTLATTVDKQKVGDTSTSKIGNKKSVVNETEEQMWIRREKEISGKSLKIDNRILNLGFQYFHHKIVGANARCLALLVTLREVIGSYKTPEEKDLSRDLEKSLLNPCISYLNYCRPISTSMGNAIKYLKYHISKIPSNMEDEAAINRLQSLIDEFITEKIAGASKTIAEYSKAKINDNDVILIFAGSSLIARVLKDAHKAGKKFRVIVVEGRPRTEGKTMLRFLVKCGIPCSYTYIGSAVYAMSEVTKVFLGAAAMFATGDMYSRSGNSMIAALARANNIPVLVCCETYKFTDKVQLHTGDSNLHAQGRDLITIGNRPQILGNYEELGLRMLNIMYDVTGSKYITCLITEQGLLLASTIPAILRRHEDLLEETAGK